MLLPPCPLRLKASFVWKHQLGGVVLLLASLGVAAGCGWWQYDAVKDLFDQSRIWQAGVPADDAETKGKETTSHGFFHSYDLNVRYLDARGVLHEGKVKFDTLGGEVDQKRDVIVHYLEDQPDRFALSWAIDVTVSRWVNVFFMVLVGVGLIGGSLALLGMQVLRRLADARRCARRSDEVMVRLTEVIVQLVKGRHQGNVYHFAGQTPDGRAISGKAEFPLKYEPLYGDSARQTLVVLVAQENLRRPVVLRSDFHPFELTPDEQAQVRAAIARRTPAPG